MVCEFSWSLEKDLNRSKAGRIKNNRKRKILANSRNPTEIDVNIVKVRSVISKTTVHGNLIKYWNRPDLLTMDQTRIIMKYGDFNMCH